MMDGEKMQNLLFFQEKPWRSSRITSISKTQANATEGGSGVNPTLAEELE